MSEERFHATKNLEAVLVTKERPISWLARRTKLSQAFMSYVVRGERTIGRAPAERIAELLEVPFFLLFDLTEVSEEHEVVKGEMEVVPA